MRQHDSEITVTSVPGDTAFDFTLPATGSALTERFEASSRRENSSLAV